MNTRLCTCLLLVLAATRAHAADVVIYRCTDAGGSQSLQNAPCPKGQTQQKVMTSPVPSAPAHTSRPAAADSDTATPADLALRSCVDARGGISIIRGSACPAVTKPDARTPHGVPVPPMPAPIPASPAHAATPGVLDSAAAAPASIPSAPPGVGPAQRLPPPALYQCGAPDQGSYLSEDNAPKSRCVPLQVTGLDGRRDDGRMQACQMVNETCAPLPQAQLCAGWKQRRDMAKSRLAYAGSDERDQAAADLSRLQKIVDETTCGAPDQTP